MSRKQQKRLQDEEKRKKEEQTPQVKRWRMALMLLTDISVWVSDKVLTPAVLLQNWGKKGSGEKGRGGGGKLPPRFAKKQSSQQNHQQQQNCQPQPSLVASISSAPSQPQAPISVPQHPQPATVHLPLGGVVAPLPPIASPAVDFTSKSLPPATSQAHSTLGTELWENKVSGSTGLPDVKKRE